MEAVLKTGRHFATLLRVLRKDTLGSRYSQSWNVLGFRGTTQVPLTADGMYVMLGAMAGYLEKNPQFNFDVTINATQAKALQDGLADAKSAVNKAKSRVTQLFQARAKVVTRGRRLLRKILNDLAYEMDPLDPRWIEFGFNQPGLKATPEAPKDVTVVQMSESVLVVNWPPVARAERYRLSMKVVGVDAEMVTVGTTTDTNFTLESFPKDAELELAVLAANERGESRKSAVVKIKTSISS